MPRLVGAILAAAALLAPPSASSASVPVGSAVIPEPCPSGGACLLSEATGVRDHSAAAVGGFKATASWSQPYKSIASNATLLRPRATAPAATHQSSDVVRKAYAAVRLKSPPKPPAIAKGGSPALEQRDPPQPQRQQLQPHNTGATRAPAPEKQQPPPPRQPSSTPSAAADFAGTADLRRATERTRQKLVMRDNDIILLSFPKSK
jgi:hypothetical protein